MDRWKADETKNTWNQWVEFFIFNDAPHGSVLGSHNCISIVLFFVLKFELKNPKGDLFFVRKHSFNINEWILT